MVKKTIAIWAIGMVLMTSYGSIITSQPLEIPTVDYENDENQEVVENLLAQSPITISTYDPIFQEICNEYGNDWRFMSAMAYHESRFRPDVTSSQGAQGMMQIMPHIAESFNVSIEELNDVETNIRVANQLVNSTTKMLKLTDAIPERDRMGLILACYNGGIAYVFHAQKLARKNGENPYSWDVVAEYLRQMKSEDFALENEVRQFKGASQTLAYVKNVIGHYNIYCQMAAL